MEREISIGEAELEIMKVIWSAKEPLTSVDIGRAVEERGWKKTTIATFLTRLTEKGAVTAEKRGKLYYYTANISQKEYRRSRTKNLIASLYGGSVKEFAASLFGDVQLTDEEAAELMAILEDRGE